MQENYSNLENLLQGSIQILDHMKLNSPDDAKLQQMKQTLEQEYANLQNLSLQTGNVEQARQTIASMQRRIHELEQQLEPLESELHQEYKQDTGNATDAFERRPLDDQKNEENTYHSKIDYRSAEKLRDNFDKIGGELLDLSGRMEHNELSGRAAASAAGTAATATATSAGAAPEFDHDPAPPSVSP